MTREATAANRNIVWADEFWEILLSAFGGARYGARIRLPHALIMSLLFGQDSNHVSYGTFLSLMRKVLKVTVEHASNLAKFAAVYKTALLALKLIHPLSLKQPHVIGQPNHSWHAGIAGAIGGYCIWGHYSAVNHQMLLYLSSRVLLGVWKKLALWRLPYPMVAAFIWGVVMYLFEDDPQVLHPSLKSSMDEIYRYSTYIVLGLSR